MKVSIIIPVLNEVSTIGQLLQTLQPVRTHGHEIILVDGGSTDGTRDRVRNQVDRLIQELPGRAAQMNCGAQAASGEILWFLHADTRPPAPVLEYISAMTSSGKAVWGWFPVILSSRKPIYRVIAFMMNTRARISRIATGDQGIFVSRTLFDRLQGYEHIPLMEDIRLTARLKKIQSPLRCHLRLETSSRRWEQKGVCRTILLMWYLRFAHYLGASPDSLARKYHS